MVSFAKRKSLGICRGFLLHYNVIKTDNNDITNNFVNYLSKKSFESYNAYARTKQKKEKIVTQHVYH